MDGSRRRFADQHYPPLHQLPPPQSYLRNPSPLPHQAHEPSSGFCNPRRRSSASEFVDTILRQPVPYMHGTDSLHTPALYDNVDNAQAAAARASVGYPRGLFAAAAAEEDFDQLLPFGEKTPLGRKRARSPSSEKEQTRFPETARSWVMSALSKLPIVGSFISPHATPSAEQTSGSSQPAFTREDSPSTSPQQIDQQQQHRKYQRENQRENQVEEEEPPRYFARKSAVRGDYHRQPGSSELIARGEEERGLDPLRVTGDLPEYSNSDEERQDLLHILQLRRLYNLPVNISTPPVKKVRTAIPGHVAQPHWDPFSSIAPVIYNPLDSRCLQTSLYSDVNPFVGTTAPVGAATRFRRKRGLRSCYYRKLLRQNKFHPCKWIDYFDYAKAQEADREDRRYFATNKKQPTVPVSVESTKHSAAVKQPSAPARHSGPQLGAVLVEFPQPEKQKPPPPSSGRRIGVDYGVFGDEDVPPHRHVEPRQPSTRRAALTSVSVPVTDISDKMFAEEATSEPSKIASITPPRNVLPTTSPVMVPTTVSTDVTPAPIPASATAKTLSTLKPTEEVASTTAVPNKDKPSAVIPDNDGVFAEDEDDDDKLVKESKPNSVAESKPDSVAETTKVTQPTPTLSAITAATTPFVFGSAAVKDVGVTESDKKSNDITPSLAKPDDPSLVETSAAATTTEPSKLGAVKADGTTTPSFGQQVQSAPSLFGSKQVAPTTSLFSNATVMPSQEVSSAPKQSLFGAPPSSATTMPPSLFQTTSPSAAGPTSSQTSSLFGGSSGAPGVSLFGSTSLAKESNGANVSISSNLFGTTSKETPNLFGSTTKTNTSNVFGSSSQESLTPSIFASKENVSHSFGMANSQDTSSAPGIFGAKSATEKPMTNLFGATSTKEDSSSFGSPAKENSTSIFSVPGPATTEAAKPSMFGVSGSTNLFSGPQSTSLFGVFGSGSNKDIQQPTDTAKTPFLFGTPASTQPQSAGSLFGPTSQQQPATLFGASSAQPLSLFGGQSTTQQAPNLFGDSTSGNMFQTSSTGGFGQMPQPGSLFGTAGNVDLNSNMNGESSRPTSLFGTISDASGFQSGGIGDAGSGGNLFGTTAVGQQQFNAPGATSLMNQQLSGAGSGASAAAAALFGGGSQSQGSNPFSSNTAGLARRPKIRLKRTMG